MSKDPDFVPVPEAARRLSIGLTLAWRMVRDGTLGSRRFGRAVRVPVREIERLAAEAAAAN